MEPSETPKPRSIVFVHVPRTAGSSTHGAFQAACLRRWFVTDRPETLSHFYTDVQRNLDQGVYLGGHFSLKDVERELQLDVSRTVNFTVIRHPVERVISLYNYILTNPASNPPIYKAVVDKDIGYFIAFMCTHFPDRICNSQCLQISGSVNADDALTALQEKFDFAATCDRIGEMVSSVWQASNQTWVVKAPAFEDWVNAAGSSDAPSDEVRTKIDRVNQEDARLYRFMMSHGGLFRSFRRPTGGASRFAKGAQ